MNMGHIQNEMKRADARGGPSAFKMTGSINHDVKLPIWQILYPHFKIIFIEWRPTWHYGITIMTRGH